MQDSLLSYIASNFIREYENVANSSVAYLLNKYPSVRMALKRRLDINQIPNYFETEVSANKNGRFDIAGKDYYGKISFVIEGKFWANLTENQPVNYLKELGENGVLLFLAPEKRLLSLKNEISRRLAQDDSRIYFLSWYEFLNSIEIENNKSYDAALASDLLQLKELCNRMDVEGMPPLSLSDLDPMNGKISYHLADLIDDCNKILRNWEEADFSGLKTTAFKGGYGFYFKALGFGCQLVFSSFDWFTKESQTPILLRIWDINFKKDRKIFYILNRFDSLNTYDDDTYCSYGIIIMAGMDRNQVVNYIEKSVQEILRYLNENYE